MTGPGVSPHRLHRAVPGMAFQPACTVLWVPKLMLLTEGAVPRTGAAVTRASKDIVSSCLWGAVSCR